MSLMSRLGGMRLVLGVEIIAVIKLVRALRVLNELHVVLVRPSDGGRVRRGRVRVSVSEGRGDERGYVVCDGGRGGEVRRGVGAAGPARARAGEGRGRGVERRAGLAAVDGAGERGVSAVCF